MSCEEKLDILCCVDKVVCEADKCVQEVIVSFSGVYELILVVVIDGTLVVDVCLLVCFFVSVFVEEDGKRERGVSGGGGCFGYEFFFVDFDGEVCVDVWVKEVVCMVLVNFFVVVVLVGIMLVVFGVGWLGVLLYEVVGYGLEGDFNCCGILVFSGQVGELVVLELCIVVDDGMMVDCCGLVVIDDEGMLGQYNVLIENGILKGYMQDKFNVCLMGMMLIGNGCCEFYVYLFMLCMINIYMLLGKLILQEIIEFVEYGIYVLNFGGGQVDIIFGKFVFFILEVYLIENGKVMKLVKGVMLIGFGIEIMQQILMVGNDLKLDNGVGVCGKEG